MAKKTSKFKSGEYSLPMLEFLGEDILRESVKESDIAIETAQKLSGEVRAKALGTVGVLSTFLVALFVATYKIPHAHSWFYVCCVTLMAVFGYGILRLFCGIIYNKENQNGGNTLSILLNQETLDGLSSAKDEAERVRLFLFYSLGQKEFVCNKIDEETARMQGCYKSTMTQVSFLILFMLIVYSLVCWLSQA